MKKQTGKENFLECKPMRTAGVAWREKNGVVTLEIENKGVFNKFAQLFFKKPKISYIHLDEMGSFVWPYLNGENTIIKIGEIVEKEFGEKANPLYERLAQYIKILESYGFISLNK